MSSTNAIKIADTFFKKLIGLMFKRDFSYHLLLKNCSSIHTFFMFFPIDCIYLDKNYTIIAIHKNIRPWRIIIGPQRTKSIIELKTNLYTSKLYKVGSRVTIS